MKILKITILCLVIGLFVTVQPTNSIAKSIGATNAQFADILIEVLGITMPEGTDLLSDTEYYEVQANLLSERGITLFLDRDPNSEVTKGDLSDVLYAALLGETGDVPQQEMLDELEAMGYLPGGDISDIIMLEDIIAALNLPALSQAVIEAYSPVGEEFGGGTEAPARAVPAQEGAVSPV